MENNLLIVDTQSVSSVVDQFNTSLATYLSSLDLPTANVLVENAERHRVISNLPAVINNMTLQTKADSFYLSKFVAACGAGLFDAALNFLWNETVTNLRWKVSFNDIDYFYDSIITDPKRRDKIKTVDDLVKVEEWELIRGCHLTGLLSDLGFKHLDYIRDMRNWASAAHPNQNQLTGFQLVSWLETCIKEVISKQPEPAALNVNRFLKSIREESLDSTAIAHIKTGLQTLPSDALNSLLRTIFGMYTNDGSPVQVKNNIRGIVNDCWLLASDNAKYNCGIKYQSFATNGENSRRDAANEFLTFVQGLPYLPTDTLSVEMSIKIDNLYQAHCGWNNFHNEPAHASALSAYISSTGIIPESVRKDYVKTIVMCKLGNGHGVSSSAIGYYDQMISKFGDSELKEFVKLVLDNEFVSRVSLSRCAEQYKNLAITFTTANQIIIQALNQITGATVQQIPNLGRTTAYQRLVSS
ncbi:hypothetical protein [Serratia fonticola]|uniref:hypothetical protein n=1 Tax=Serratia fonticola TaxID=47917 RepID=UPI00217A1189|nr:hypothetical protein [Serratia fonticola]CAI1227213.1 Uncharacterised protein [Serratia fonticola]